jgi:hypothetical protein
MKGAWINGVAAEYKTINRTPDNVVPDGSMCRDGRSILVSMAQSRKVAHEGELQIGIPRTLAAVMNKTNVDCTCPP